MIKMVSNRSGEGTNPKKEPVKQKGTGNPPPLREKRIISANAQDNPPVF